MCQGLPAIEASDNLGDARRIPFYYDRVDGGMVKFHIPKLEYKIGDRVEGKFKVKEEPHFPTLHFQSGGSHTSFS